MHLEALWGDKRYVPAGKGQDKLIIGLTGSFGSGCSEVAKILAATGDFHAEPLSKAIKDKARKRGLKVERRTLQDVGDNLREQHGLHTLSERAVLAARKAEPNRDWVLDGIRNLGEIAWLRSQFPAFYLVGVDASEDTRWKRLRDKSAYNGNFQAFKEDDKRDKSGPLKHGQQVAACVDAADVLLLNEEDFSRSKRKKDSFGDKILDYVGLMRSPGKRPPEHLELLMNQAYSASLRSSCMKRQVGAVISSEDHLVLSTGYNEVPPGEASCRVEHGDCYRDKVRTEYARTLGTLVCQCGAPLNARLDFEAAQEDTKCPKCRQELAPLYHQGKLLDYCRALHAEETAILHAPRLGGVAHLGMRIYTTTFPCHLCAKKIVHAGIKEVVYVEPYPGEEAAELLKRASVVTTRFEGVKAYAFHKLFKRQPTALG